MVEGNNKGITSIGYNHLSLPTAIKINTVDAYGDTQDGRIAYVYDATVVKLQKKVFNHTNNSIVITSYAGGYIYEDVNGQEALKMFPHPEGYVAPVLNTTKSVNKLNKNAGTFKLYGFLYAFNYTDHLGNVRLTYADTDGNGSINPSSEILQERNYYPLGLEHRGYNNVINGTENNHRTFNGKELEESLGLNVIEMDWRQYDPALGRFNVIDALTEERDWLSPYNFAQNNPILRIDPTGLLDDYGLDQDGNISLLRETDDTTDKLIALDSDGAETDTSIEVDKGILNNQYSQTGTNSNGDTFTYDILKVRGDEQATNLFEFVANNTNVEWSQTMLGVEGENGLNYLTTSQDKATEKGIAQMINTQFHNGYTIRGHRHTHPGNTPYPSGLNDGSGDIGFSTAVTNWYNNKYPGRATPTFEIYTPQNGTYIKYNKSSTMSDFMTIKLPEVIIKN